MQAGGPTPLQAEALAAERALRQEQDEAYAAALDADRRRAEEAAARAAAEEAEAAAAAAALAEEEAAAASERERLLALRGELRAGLSVGRACVRNAILHTAFRTERMVSGCGCGTRCRPRNKRRRRHFCVVTHLKHVEHFSAFGYGSIPSAISDSKSSYAPLSPRLSLPAMTRRRCWCACGCQTAPAIRAASGRTMPCSRCASLDVGVCRRASVGDCLQGTCQHKALQCTGVR